jgi:hypothetical protein
MKLFTSLAVGLALFFLAASVNAPAADKKEKPEKEQPGAKPKNPPDRGGPRNPAVVDKDPRNPRNPPVVDKDPRNPRNPPVVDKDPKNPRNPPVVDKDPKNPRNPPVVDKDPRNPRNPSVVDKDPKNPRNPPGVERTPKNPPTKPPSPELSEVKKPNGEIERRAPSGAVRERTKVDEKSGAKQTERLAATGRVETREVVNKSGEKQITHYDLGREKKAEVIRKDGSKEITDVHYNRDGKERAREIVKTDVRGKEVSKTVVKTVTINKTVIKTEHNYVVGRYGYVYRPVVVRPVLFVNPYWYTPAGVVIVHPFRYTWGFQADPWYGYHAYYWEPYPVYQAPSYWVTDWMVAGYVAESYAISASAAQTREEVRLAREDAEKARSAAERAADAAEKAEAQAEQAAAEARAAKAEARAAKAELEETKRKELAGKPNPKATPIDKETKEALQSQIAKTIEEKKKVVEDQVSPDVTVALADPDHIYPVSKKIACIRAEDDEPAGFLTPGDMLKLKKGQEIPKEPGENTFVTMVVMTSKGDDDSVTAGTKIKVSIKDLQEFDSEFRAKLDTGLVEAGKNQDAFKSGAI